MLSVLVDRVVHRYLGMFDRVLPNRLGAFYVVGSVALDAFQPGRSDIDFVAVLTGAWNRRDLVWLRAMNWWAAAVTGTATVEARLPRWPPGLNGIFIRPADLTASPCRGRPIASQSAGRFWIGRGFDMNPVTWRVLADHGIAIRGPQVGALNIYQEDDELRGWVADNLSTYWATWSKRVSGLGWVASEALLRRRVAWGVLGAPRLHATLATGNILSKEQAGEYALEWFPQWRPLILDALAYWRGQPSERVESRRRRRQAGADFVAAVVSDARHRFREAMARSRRAS